LNSVALPASASSPAVSAEVDLVRQAGRGDGEAFHELYRRHSQPAWRLAQAVAPNRESAVAAFRDGFTKAVRSHKQSRRDPSRGAFRPQVLAAVYRSGVDQNYERDAIDHKPASSRAKAATPEAALADAAFRSLPERWRAAVWLSEVENLDPPRIATVLGVSVPVATQLVARGRRGLAGRFAQAHQEAPEHLGPVIRPLAFAIPANLAEVAEAKWRATRIERSPILAPATAWLEEKGKGPMSATVASLVALGVIGLAVVPGGSAVRGQLGASGPGSLSGSVPVHTCFGLPCGTSTASSNGLGSSPGSFSTAAYTASGGTGAGGGSGFGGCCGSAGGSQTPGGGGFLNLGGGGGSGSGGGSTQTGGGGNQTGGGGGSPPTTTTVPPVNLNLGPVGGVSGSTSGLQVNLLPSSSGSNTASVSVGSGGAGLSLGGTTIAGSSPSTTTTTTTVPATTTTTNPVTGVVNGLTTTVTTLLKGL
jgi:DNA-directed RNA polymerase specialized sigma24 family protein